MSNDTWLKIEGGFSFVITTNSVRVLQEAAEKYKVDIPLAKIIIIYSCGSGMLDYYIKLEGCYATRYAFSEEGEKIGIAYGSDDEENIRNQAVDFLIFILDYMDWDKILEEYLAEKGIAVVTTEPYERRIGIYGNYADDEETYNDFAGSLDSYEEDYGEEEIGEKAELHMPPPLEWMGEFPLL